MLVIMLVTIICLIISSFRKSIDTKNSLISYNLYLDSDIISLIY